MKKIEFKDFSKVWTATAKLNSSSFIEPNESDLSIAFSDLQRFSLFEINTALEKFRKMTERRLTPAVIDSIITGCFWLSADEAWGLAQRTFDPTRSVVVTKEIITAASKVDSMYNGGERTAAKNTFTAIYERLMMAAISSGEAPKWQVWNLEYPTRENSTENAKRLAITEAMDNGIIPMQTAILLGYTPKQKTLSLQVLSDNAPDEDAKNQIARLKQICSGVNKNG